MDERGWAEHHLGFTPPFLADHVLAWLRIHAIVGVEQIEGTVYRRTMRLAHGPAVIEVDLGTDSGDRLPMRARLSNPSDLTEATAAIRRLLDLDTDTNPIEAALAIDPALAALVTMRPGLRSPGDVAGIDIAVRAVLHQQVSVASAAGVGARLARMLGDPLAEPMGSLTHVMPTAETWSEQNPDDLGLPKSRANALVAIATAVADGSLELSPGADLAAATETMLSIKGIGPWTASIVGMKALGDRDAFCPGDLALRRAAASIGLPEDGKELAVASESWRPWRSTAMHHLWAHYLES